MELRVLTLNLKGLESDWFERRRPVLLPGLRALAPDVIALQEVAIRGKPFYHQAQDLGHELSMASLAYAPYGNPAEVHSHEQGGVALLARWPLQLLENRRLPPGRHQPDNRVALLASILQPPRPVHVAVTHLSWPPEEGSSRSRQLATILERARAYGWLSPSERFVLAGDLNAPPDDAGIAGIPSLLRDAWSAVHPGDAGATWSHANPYTGGYPLPSRRLDYLFVDRHAEVLDARLVFADPEAGFVSDHFGLMADFRWEDRLGP